MAAWRAQLFYLSKPKPFVKSKKHRNNHQFLKGNLLLLIFLMEAKGKAGPFGTKSS